MAVDALGVLGVGEDVVNLDRMPLKSDAACDRTAVELERVLSKKRDLLRRGAAVGHQVKPFAPPDHDEHMLRLAKALRGLSDGVQDGLNIRWRTAYDVKHFARRCLVFKRLLQLARARLHLSEKPHVLNCNHSLIGKCGKELDLPRGDKPGSVRSRAIAPIGTPSRSIGTAMILRVPVASAIAWT